MAEYTKELATDISIPHIDVYRTYADGILTGYDAMAHDGYVFYDPNDDYISVDDRTGEETLVRYYYTIRLFAYNYDISQINLVAVLRSSVNENDIFGDDNDHEVM